MTDTTDIPVCGAWPQLGGCVAPSGHNMGHVDVPENHRFEPKRPPVRVQVPRVRMIRVLEYDFVDQATAEATLRYFQVPPNGVKQFGSAVIRSATTFPETMPCQDLDSCEGNSDD